MNKSDYLSITKEVLFEKINVIEEALKDTQSSANSDTKSSAGDKHETSRAMAHIENERLAGQLANLQAQLDVLYKINPEISSEKVSFGSVVKTETNTFFISTGLGKIENNGNPFFAIASNSPIGMKMIGKTLKDNIKMGSITNTIVNVF